MSGMHQIQQLPDGYHVTIWYGASPNSGGPFATAEEAWTYLWKHVPSRLRPWIREQATEKGITLGKGK